MLKYLLFTFFIILKSISADSSFSKSSNQGYNIVELVHKVVKDVQISNSLPENFFIPDDIQIPSHLEMTSLISDDEVSNISSHCLRDLMYVFENINKTNIQNSWALQMLDSFGKPESSFLEGNLKWIGDYDECKSVYAPKNNASRGGGFHGRYCSLVVSLGSPMAAINVGVCLPDSCNSADLNEDIKKFINITKRFPYINQIDPLLNATTVTCKSNSRELTTAAIATICLFSFFLLLAALGSSLTVLKYFTTFWKFRNCPDENSVSINHQDERDSDDILLITEGSKTRLSVFFDRVEPFFNCFCIFTNGSKLLNTDSTEGQMLCLHGIRFLSMSWVILCHTYAFSFLVVRKLKGIIDDIDNWPFQVVLNGFYSVDSFFVLSGFLMSYLYFQEAAKKKGNISWIYFYIHRYLRLTPVYMLMIGFYTVIFPYIGNGPFWPDYLIEPVCQKHWWWNILYINNFLGSADMCMGWSWYLANDMQFFVISPIFLITLWRWPKIGYSVLALFLGGSCIASFLISYHYKLFAGFGDITAIASQPDFLQRWTDDFDKLYIKPYTRIGPYLVGIALGYIMFKRQLTRSKTNYIVLCFGWAVATAVGLTCVYGLYHKTPGVVAASFYNALNRTSYALCLSWVIFTCLSQQAGAVDKILSFKLFIPLSRLTYSAYLIHPMVLTGYFYSMKTTLNFSHPTMVTLFLGLMLVTYALSLIVSLLFESPIIRVEKLMQSKFQS